MEPGRASRGRSDLSCQYRLWGEAGADRFLYAAAADSGPTARDTIFDFSHLEGDRIDLSAIDAVSGGKNDSFSLVGGFTHQAGQLVSAWEVDHWVVQGDVNGDGVADFAISVFSPTALTSSDFIL